MKVKTVNIDSDVEQVLRDAILDGSNLTLQGQLTRPMYTKVNKVLDLMGFKWSRKEKCHVGKGDTADKLREGLNTGSVVDEKKTYQFFATPPSLAEKMVALADLQEHDRVLEPSAGKGAIIDEIYKRRPGIVFACELNPAMFTALYDELRTQLVGHDFLDHNGYYDKIIMNPPFTAGQDIQHVLHAYDLLSPGGRLVALMSPGWISNVDSTPSIFRGWLGKQVERGFAEEPEVIQAGTFKQSGTQIATVLLVINKAA